MERLATILLPPPISIFAFDSQAATVRTLMMLVNIEQTGSFCLLMLITITSGKTGDYESSSQD